MAKFRPRVKGKGKRWQKGHSSSSNPETKKFRDAAKSRFFQENLGKLYSLTLSSNVDCRDECNNISMR